MWELPVLETGETLRLCKKCMERYDQGKAIQYAPKPRTSRP